MECPECGSEMVLRKSKYGLFYGCSRYPKCKATHGAHKSGRPLGIPANKETKLLRIEVHRIFDKLWKGEVFSRTKSYKKLAELMNLPIKETHIGRFNKEQCLEALHKLREFIMKERLFGTKIWKPMPGANEFSLVPFENQLLFFHKPIKSGASFYPCHGFDKCIICQILYKAYLEDMAVFYPAALARMEEWANES